MRAQRTQLGLQLQLRGEDVVELHSESPSITLGVWPASSSAFSMSWAWPGSTSATVSERRPSRYRRIRESAASSVSSAGSATSKMAAPRCNSGPLGSTSGRRESKTSVVEVMLAPSHQKVGAGSSRTGSLAFRERKPRTTLLGQPLLEHLFDVVNFVLITLLAKEELPP